MAESDLGTLILLSRFVGIVAPTLYTGVSASYSVTFVEPVVRHAPDEKVMARQWFEAYQSGPMWVPPMILPGTLANAFLALISRTALQQRLYVAAALGIFSVIPITLLYMEPGINGASKWKTQMLCKDDGMDLPETPIFLPWSHRHGGTRSSRKLAEQASMKDLILEWRRVNNMRWIVVGFAAGLSAYATLGFLPV